MFDFNKKILFSFIIIFLVFVVLIFPFATNTVSRIVQKGMHDRATELIKRLQQAPNNQALIDLLKDQKSQNFFRVSVIDHERKILYDTHTKRLLGPKFSQDYVVNHPEVLAALKNGSGYHEDFSKILNQAFSYYAQAFDFHGKTYVMRTAFPYKHIQEMTRDFEFGMIAVATIILLLFGAMTFFLIHLFTKPIQKIIAAITPYQKGMQNVIPEIHLDVDPTSEFGKLADTLNSLSTKIQSHIDTLIEERNQRQAVLESLGEGVIAVDNKLIITYANQAALKLLLLDQHDLIGEPFSKIQQNQGTALLSACRDERKALTETLEIIRHGRKRMLDVIATPIKGHRGAVLILQDKTSHYRLLEMRKEFIANASHELKTPITIIHGFAETLHDNPHMSLEMIAEITEKILRNSERMTHLIEDLLTLSNIESLPLSRLVDSNLIALTEQCRDTILTLYPDAEVEIQSPPSEIHLVVDPALIEHALINLLDNAAKYSHPPPKITIRLEEKPETVSIQIQDRGIGIPAPDLDHIFERFYTVDKTHSRKLGGSGLGLSIVQNIVQKHSGKVSVESVLGEGTTFTLTFPKSN